MGSTCIHSSCFPTLQTRNPLSSTLFIVFLPLVWFTMWWLSNILFSFSCFWILEKGYHGVGSPQALAFFFYTQCYINKTHPFCYVWLWFIQILLCVMFLFAKIPSIFIHSLVERHFGFFLGFFLPFVHCCYEYSCPCLLKHLCKACLWIFAQQRNCWVLKYITWILQENDKLFSNLSWSKMTT